MIGLFTRERRQAERPEAADRRGGRRNRVLLRGKIVHGAGFSFDCSIRDLSGGGACVTLPQRQFDPGEMQLLVIRDGVVHRARTAWARPPMIGLAFEESHDFSEPAPPHLRSLRHLWVELAGRK